MMMTKPIKVAGIFRVDGVTLILCKKIVTKKLELWLPKGGDLTPEIYEAKFNQEVAALLESMKPKAISKEFDTPESAREYIKILKRSTPVLEYRDLRIMINVASMDKQGGIKRNKKTFKPTMTWEPYNPDFDYSQIIKELSNQTVQKYLKEAA
jgi:hypothetical protein